MESERKQRLRLVLAHQHDHWEALVHDTIPLFVASTLSRAVIDIVRVIDEDTRTEASIAIVLAYSLVSHTLGYFVNYFTPPEHPLAAYYICIANDNASFAWSTTCTLVILHWLYNRSKVELTVAAWIVLALLVCTFLFVTSLLQRLWLRPTHVLYLRLRAFESEAFALSLAYSATVMLAVFVYRNAAMDYLSYSDDDSPLTNEQDRRSASSWYFFTYVIGITIGMVFYQKSLNMHRKQKSLLTQSPRVSSQDSESGSSSSGNDEAMEDTGIQDEIIEDYAELESPMRNAVSVAVFHRSNNRATRHCLSEIRKRVLFWDKNHRCFKTFQNFWYTLIGYTVSSGWTVWALLSVQDFFLFKGGKSFGLLLYALLATILISCMLAYMTAKPIIREVKSAFRETAEDVAPGTLLKRSSTMYLSFARLTVGWAWQEFFFSVIHISTTTNLHKNVEFAALIKSGLSVLAFFLGIKIELWMLNKDRPQNATRLSLSLSADSSTTPLL